MSWLLDLQVQVRRVLLARNGGTGNNKGGAKYVVEKMLVRSSGEDMVRGNVVHCFEVGKANLADDGDDDAVGVVLGKWNDDGRIDEAATATHNEYVAVILHGFAQVLLDEDVVQGEYAFPSATPGSVKGETDPDTGMIGRFAGDGSAGGYAMVKLGGGGGGGGGSLASPLTTKGDIWGYSTTDARVPVGSNGQVLTANSSDSRGVSLATPGTSTLTTKGDLLTRSSSALVRKGVGTDGYLLSSRSGDSSGIAWEQALAELEFDVASPSGGLATPPLRVPFDCAIVGWTILCDASGSIVFDVWKDSYANYPPTVADTIAASAKPTVSAATKATSTTLTGWTTALSAGDVLIANVDSVSGIGRARLYLHLRRT